MKTALGLLGATFLAGAFLLLAPSPPPAAAADYDCGDFGSQAEAQEYLLPGDPYGLDADSDGIACEDNPCPCSGESGGNSGSGPSHPSEPKPPPPYRLKMSTAKRISKRLVRRAVNRSPRLDSAAFAYCRQSAARRVDCAFIAVGRSQTQKLTCRYDVTVRARNRHPEGRIAARHCRSESLRRLTYARAKAEMKPKAAEVAGKQTSLDLTRLSQLMFVGYAEWLRPSPAGKTESCALEMTAELLPSDEVRVTTGQVFCETLL